MRRKIYKASVWALVNFPFYQTCIMCGHVVGLLLGYEGDLAQILSGVSLLNCVLLYLMSIAFKCCALHRALCVYPFGVSVCIEHQRLFGFGTALFWARLAVATLGVVIIVLAIRQNLKNKAWKNTSN